MRWRFADKLELLQPWQSIRGTKAVSLEEYCLCEPRGREGVLPETLVIECCVHAARWLVARSSDFRLTCELDAIDGFRFTGEAAMGDVIAMDVEAAPDSRADAAGGSLHARCRASCGGRLIAEGGICVRLLPLAGHFDRDSTEAMWRELHGEA
ncbi:MAG TPA: hypothetical protein VM223_09265 [Planctomycetota bacterium]|nr:hypothetical protein [Planctomycetota bacterium]